MKTYYHAPVQVMFHDGSGWNMGIAFEDKVICACCGVVFPIKNLLDNLDEDITCPIYEYDFWVSITDDITDNIADGFTELPRGLILTEDNQIKEVQ